GRAGLRPVHRHRRHPAPAGRAAGRGQDGRHVHRGHAGGGRQPLRPGPGGARSPLTLTAYDGDRLWMVAVYSLWTVTVKPEMVAVASATPRSRTHSREPRSRLTVRDWVPEICPGGRVATD